MQPCLKFGYFLTMSQYHTFQKIKNSTSRYVPIPDTYTQVRASQATYTRKIKTNFQLLHYISVSCKVVLVYGASKITSQNFSHKDIQYIPLMTISTLDNKALHSCCNLLFVSSIFNQGLTTDKIEFFEISGKNCMFQARALMTFQKLNIYFLQ